LGALTLAVRRAAGDASTMRSRVVALACVVSVALAAVAPLAHACTRRTVVNLSGVPAACSGSFALSASVAGRASVARVTVELDGKPLAAADGRSVRSAVDCASLGAGQHKLVVTARTKAGKTVARTARFAVR
jgi:hypothetical protein